MIYYISYSFFNVLHLQLPHRITQQPRNRPSRLLAQPMKNRHFLRRETTARPLIALAFRFLLLCHDPRSEGYRIPADEMSTQQNFWKCVCRMLLLRVGGWMLDSSAHFAGLGVSAPNPHLLGRNFKRRNGNKRQDVQSKMLWACSKTIHQLFFHLAFAPCLAIFERSAFERLAARAFPPFSPPIRPSATACGFLELSDSDSFSVCSPVARSTMNFARAFVSRGRCGFFIGRKIRNFAA